MKIKTKTLVTTIVGFSAGLLVFAGLFKVGDLFIKASVTQSDDESVSFTDELPSWAADSINRLSSAGIVKGYGDGRFGAADNLTRGQVVTFLYRTLKHKNIIQDPDSTQCYFYDDIKDTDYYFTPVCLLTLNSGTTVLNSDPTLFSPDTPVTRAEAAKLIDSMLGDTLLQAMNTTRDTNVVFPDVPKNHAYFDNIALAYKTGLMVGKSTGLFDPNGLLNRAEIAVVMDRTLNLLESLEIKELADTLATDPYLIECADLISSQTTVCSAYENWFLSIQVLKQNAITGENNVEIDKITYGPGNKCSSAEAGGKFPADIQSKFLDNQKFGGGEETQVLCEVTCMGWSDCSEEEELTNKCTGDSMTTSDCLTTCDGTCQASSDQANCSICVPCDETEDTDGDTTQATDQCGEEPFYDCSQCNGLPSYPTFQYEDCLTSCQNAFYDASAAYNACLEQY